MTDMISIYVCFLIRELFSNAIVTIEDDTFPAGLRSL